MVLSQIWHHMQEGDAVPEDLEVVVLAKIENDKTLPTQAQDKLARVKRSCHNFAPLPFSTLLIGAPPGQNTVRL
jgi:hypothetical protein